MSERLDGRWVLDAPAAGETAVGRRRGTAVDSGAPVEVLSLQPAGAWSRTAHGAFLDAHRTIQRASDPALVKVHAVGWAEDHAWVVRDPLEDLTLADVPGPLAPGVVAALGARLLPAVLAAGDATGGALLPRDVGLDAKGAAVLAPRARPADRVSPEDTRYTAPEAYRGARPDGAAGLYGLGVLLYRLTTGREPLKGVSVVPAGNWVAGLPPGLDRALALLLDENPVRRAAALPLLAEGAGPIPDLRLLARRPVRPATVPSSEVKVTTTPSRPGSLTSAKADVAAPRSAVVVPRTLLEALSPAERSALAGHAGLPLSRVDGLVRDGLPLVLGVHRARDGAEAPAATLARDTGLPIAAAYAPGLALPTAALAILSVAAVFGAVGVILWPLLVVAAAVGLAGGAVALQWRHKASAWNDVRAGWKALEHASGGSPRLAARWERLAALRRDLARSPIPDTAATDLRGALRDVERHLDDLDRIEATVEEALSAAHAPDLRTRITSLSSAAARDPRAADERDRLARTLADLEAVQDRQERLRADLTRVDDALDDLAAVLAEIGSRPESTGAIESLRATTRLTRETLGEGAPAPPKGRQTE